MFRNKKILITGGTGLIGRQIAKLLYDAGAIITTVSLEPNGLPNISHICADLTDSKFCCDIVSDKDYIFHLAGLKGSPVITHSRASSFFVPILQMNTNILEACRIASIKGIVYTSSIGAYSYKQILKESDAWQGNPMDFWPGWAKRIGEFQIESYKLEYGNNNFAIVRLTNIYGPGDKFDAETSMFIPSLMAKIKRGDNPVLIHTNGNEVRDFLYSEDVASGIIQAMQYGLGKGIINLGGTEYHTIKEVIETMAEIIPFNYKFSDKPASYPIRIMDISKAQELLGYKPSVGLKEGLKRTWEWFSTCSPEKASDFDSSVSDKELRRCG